jgi:alpha-beta hydrolase superfamily lysophospholipase
MKKQANKKGKGCLKRLFWGLFILILGGFALLNWITYNHAYRFTHTDESLQGEHPQRQVYQMQHASLPEKIYYAFWGIAVPKSMNKSEPAVPYTQVWLTAEQDSIEAWWLDLEDPVGTVLVAHGYGSCKGNMSNEINWWLGQGYSVLAIDFRGHGGSAGNHTTIGFEEAKDVKQAVDWLNEERADLPLVLFGTSMGSVAILKAAKDYDLKAKALVLECPFASLRQAVKNRFELMDIPSWGLVDLLVFWGGQQSGFSAFDHQPVEYAKEIETPTLILYGARDPKVKSWEVEEIYENLAAKQKELVIIPEAGHNHMLRRDEALWSTSVLHFIEEAIKN